jgi:RsiW-degrading membrane proteinase PrsW (M82 family)
VQALRDAGAAVTLGFAAEENIRKALLP